MSTKFTMQDLKDKGYIETDGRWLRVKPKAVRQNAATGKKSSKYRNKRVQDENGVRFDSMKELSRWNTLKLLERSGAISDLKRQVSFELNEGGSFPYKYVADFAYWAGDQFIVDDCKGFKTREYLKKRKLMLKIHGITILET